MMIRKNIDWELILKKLFYRFVFWSFLSLIFMILLSLNGTAAIYNTTNITNANNFYDQATALNDITDGLVGYSILLTVSVIAFIITSSNFNALAGLGAGSFIAALTSTILLPLGFISFHVYQLTLIVCGISVVLSLWLQR